MPDHLATQHSRLPSKYNRKYTNYEYVRQKNTVIAELCEFIPLALGQSWPHNCAELGRMFINAKNSAAKIHHRTVYEAIVNLLTNKRVERDELERTYFRLVGATPSDNRKASPEWNSPAAKAYEAPANAVTGATDPFAD
jgi:hypothetical protein